MQSLKVHIFYSLIISILLLSSVSDTFCQIKSQKDFKTALVSKIDSILQTKVNLDEIPGAVIEIKQGDRIISKKAYGYAQKYDYNHQLLSPPEKMTTDHLFDIIN